GSEREQGSREPHRSAEKKAERNAGDGKRDPRHKSRASKSVSRAAEAANKNVVKRAISSPSRRRDRKEREPAAGPALRTVVAVVDTLLNVGQSLLFLGYHFLREFRVRKGLGIILPVGEHPRHEAFQGVALGSISEL